MQRDGRDFTVEVSADGEGLVSHAGSALLAQVADKTGLTGALSLRLAGLKARRSGHDPGRVVRDLAVMLADGGDCLADLRCLGDQEALFGDVASGSTAFRLIDRIASEPGLLDAVRAAHARARARAWELAGAPERLTIDLDATLIGAHSEKEGAAGNFKGGYGFHPLLAYGDETDEALAGELRPGNAGANSAADQIAVAEQALEQIPVDYIEDIDLLLRVDSAGASHELLDWCRAGQIRFSVGYDLTEAVRGAILQIPESSWVCALEQDGSERRNGQVAEITDRLDLKGWPEGSRVIVRRERPHPGAQLSFTDHDGHRFQAILTDQTDSDIAVLERRHRARARVEDHIRNDKDTGLSKLPFKDFCHNQVWLALVLIAHDLIAWTQRLLLTGELARAEPKRLRYRLLHIAGRLAFHGRQAKL
ncbi:MAG: IS1380 family transposase, partial [Actinobacteria bacterium]|nr:IS1380 family transposase [Actinomycetota bacterium]